LAVIKMEDEKLNEYARVAQKMFIRACDMLSKPIRRRRLIKKCFRMIDRAERKRIFGR